MGKCKVSGGISSKTGGTGSLPMYNSVPNSKMNLYDYLGRLIQERWFGPDGWVIWNRDTNPLKPIDPNANPPNPHDHDWPRDSITGKPKRTKKHLSVNPKFNDEEADPAFK